MRRVIILICCIFSAVGCNSNSVEKPDNLIGKDKMIDILYDISLLEAVKNQNLNGGISSKVANEYIYKKYKIDSVQFVKSNKYYASNIDDYKKMFDKVKERLTKETKKINGNTNPAEGQLPPSAATTTTINSDTPQVQ
ncbi:DUF4296 domain-containing protein [Flavobacterium wongokense]|uniref:DUF4296 domain-containing protein n=1 Tax=Flavobacterium wongokense TaxID=2910674 RepID=UPI001F224BD8|nr:DUF4296 domain-containing protein [Flavobacterium sp. WG47]MCF6131168.1 DUF4296 domain-containing protein [Flavobacterium sp. WG47]